MDHYQQDGFISQQYQEYPQEYQEYQEFAPPVNDYQQEYQQEYNQQWPISDPQVMRTKRPGHRKALSISYLNQNPHTHRRTFSQASSQQQQQQPLQSPIPPGHRRVHSFGQDLFPPSSPMTPPTMATPNMYQQPVYNHAKFMSNVSLNMSLGNMHMGAELFPMAMQQQMEPPLGKKRLLHASFEDSGLYQQDYSNQQPQIIQPAQPPAMYYDESAKDGNLILTQMNKSLRNVVGEIVN
jgi:hypothetical protein